MCNEMSARMVPNILKRNSKVNRKVCPQLNVTDRNSAFANENKNFFQENNCLKKEIKHKRLTNRRKQGLSLVNIWHELPNWNICSIVDDKEKMSNKNLSTSMKEDVSTNQRKLRHYTKKQDKQDEVPIYKIEQHENQFPQSHNVSLDFSDFASSCLQEVESVDLHNSIDFSSNEIFSQFNYEFYGESNSNDLTENYDSLSSINESLMSSEHSNNDTSLLDDRQLNQSCDSYCNYCLENCVSSWILASEANNNTLQKDRMLTATYNQNKIDSPNNCNLNTDMHNTYLMNETLGGNNCERTTLLINYLDNIDQPLTELINYNNEYVREEVFKETISFDQRQTCDILTDFNDAVFESDFDASLFESENQGTNKYSTDILQAAEDFGYSLSNEKFQCPLCSLTFSNARTLAMHEAAAHGGTYVILCESCGRLFNRKYHFNRHFIHCGRFKEPYRCDMCIKVYRHKSSLVHHLRETHHVHYAHHHKTKFTCSVCKKVYSKFGAFENHIKKHQNTSDKLLHYSDDLWGGRRGRRLV
nr:PREDICTED: B-cell lymphoma 6 protein homolog isoform X1 [Megachile rotundata]